MDIKGFMLQFNLVRKNTAGCLVSQGLTFANVVHVLTKEGTYTPNEDYDYLWQAIPALEAPNFIFIQSTGILNLSVAIAGTGSLIVNAMPVNKLATIYLPPGVGPGAIYIEGRSPQSSIPMAQGVPISYFCFMAKADF